MAGYFEAAGGPGNGAAIALDDVEISILRSLATQLLELLGPPPASGGNGIDMGADGGTLDLDALFAEGSTEPPKDPALARLFPDAYGDPGAAADDETRRLSAEFRRFTEGELRAGKRDNLMALIRTLDGAAQEEGDGGSAAVVTLKPEDSQRWLGALNDLRLAIATRLEISDDDSTDRLFALPDTDPNKPMVMAYFWLGGLQESLVETLLP